MEEWFCPSHCLICLGKSLTSNTNLNDSSGNLGSVSEARLGLARWPSPGEHGKFAGSICHSQHELWKRTRKEWLNGLDPWLAFVDVRMSAALIILWDYRKLYQALSSCIQLLFWGAVNHKKRTFLWLVSEVTDHYLNIRMHQLTLCLVQQVSCIRNARSSHNEWLSHRLVTTSGPRKSPF